MPSDLVPPGLFGHDVLAIVVDLRSAIKPMRNSMIKIRLNLNLEMQNCQKSGTFVLPLADMVFHGCLSIYLRVH